MTDDELDDGDEMAEHFIDANERLGEALVAIGMALGLPAPRTGATWGAPEILARIAKRNGTLGSCYDHSLLGPGDTRIAAPVIGCMDCQVALTSPTVPAEAAPSDELDDGDDVSPLNDYTKWPEVVATGSGVRALLARCDEQEAAAAVSGSAAMLRVDEIRALLAGGEQT